jgi:hypothetical protein
VVWNGLRCTPQTLVKHLLSAFHEDGVIAYDLQLLQSHEGGLAQLEDAAGRVADGSHPLASVLARIAGGYHVDYPADLHPHFSSLISFGRYCLTLPRA